MAILFVPVAVYLLLYAPGHYLLRRTASDDRRGSHLFREVLLSACCTSWIGFTLAELSVYSLPALLSCLAAVSAAAALWSRGGHSWSYDTGDLAGMAVAVLSWCWLSPPLDTRILGSDSAGYLAAGIHLSRHGSLIIHDPTVALLSTDLKRALFPAVGPVWGAPPYLRLMGSLVLRGFDSDEVLPAFHHLVTVWIAVFHGLAGSAGAQWVITLFGGLSVWAMVECAAAMAGGPTAFMFFVLLSLSAVQSWYSRFLMPEIPAQFFLWGGLACVWFWCGTRRRADAMLAGLACGVAGLMRIENAAFLFLALAIGLGIGERGVRTQHLWLFGCAAIVWAHAVGHLIHFPTHYLGILRWLPSEIAFVFTHPSWPRIAVLITSVAAVVLWQLRRAVRAFRSASPWSSAPGAAAPLMAVAVCISLWGEWQHGWSGIKLLVAYIGIPTLVAGAVGLALGAVQTSRSDTAGRVYYALVALALIQVMVAPHVTDVPIWMIRRAATIVLPALCLGAALLCRAVGRRWHWSAGAVILGLAIAGQARLFAQLRWTPYYRDGLAQIHAVAALLPPQPAVLLFDTRLTAWGLAPALWAERDLPGYFVSRYDTARISQLLQAFGALPVYWIGNLWPPHVPDVPVTRVGSYELSLLTPTLDSKTEPGSSNQWKLPVVVYSVQTHARSAGPEGTHP